MNDALLEAAGLSAADAVDLLLEPGDLALWSSYLVHGSGTNRSGHRRRLYINGYVRAGDCDRGEWAFRGGEPVPFRHEPAPVPSEALRERPEPHYPDSAATAAGFSRATRPHPSPSTSLPTRPPRHSPRRSSVPTPTRPRP